MVANLLFSQRMGLLELPRKLKLRELDGRSRNILHAALTEIIYEFSLNGCLADPLTEIVYDYYIYHLGENVSSYKIDTYAWIDFFNKAFSKWPYNKIFDTIEYICQHSQANHYMIGVMQNAIEKSNLAYFLDDAGVFVPSVTEEEGAAIKMALEAVQSSRFTAARAHLLAAGKFLDAGKPSDSIRESIHAVESIACVIAQNEKATLSDALKTLDQKKKLHPAFKQGLEKLYGYTNDERGIRHANIADDNSVTLVDALFMFGTCASFTSYLISNEDNRQY